MLIKRFIIVGCFLISTNLYAEAITDGTLGRVESLSGHFTIPDNLGQQEGGNLFHSFQTFNINTGESATFTGPSSVENIISRVTGRSESLIDGTLSSKIDGANLYLLNPSGILFGENAHLDITGSFHASTADVLHLEEGGRFDATHPSNSLLTVAQPAAFGFLGNDPGAISIQGSSINVIEGQEISLIGGDISIEGGALNAPSGRINLASVASEGQVIPQSEGLIMESFEKQGNISLSQFFWPEDEPEPLANIDVSGDGGQVFIRAGQFVLDNAWIWADNYGEQNGRIDIVVDGDMHITNSSEIAAYNYGDNQGTLVTVTANELHFNGLNPDKLWDVLEEIQHNYSPEDLIDYYGASEQEANLLLESVNDILSQDENISFDAFLEKVGKETVANFLILFIPILNKITIGNSSEFSEATGGDIRINTPVLTINTGMIEAFTEGPGDAGNIQVDAEQVTLSRFAYIEAATGFYEDVADSGSGQAGNITINATDKIALSNFSSITVGADNDTTGDAGNIDLNTPHLTLNSAQITAYNAGESDAGSIDITTDTALLTGESSIYTEAKNAGGGNIRLNVRDRLFMADNSWLTAEAFGDKPEDKGGNITISNPAIFTLDNSQLRANADAGNGGKIDINTEQFNVLGESRIDVSSELGLNGELILNSTKLKDEFLVLSPPTFQDIALSLSRCEGLTNNLSSFYLISRDTSPPAPGNLKNHLYVPSDETD